MLAFKLLLIGFICDAILSFYQNLTTQVTVRDTVCSVITSNQTFNIWLCVCTLSTNFTTCMENEHSGKYVDWTIVCQKPIINIETLKMSKHTVSTQCVRPYFAAKENDFCTENKNFNTYSD